jgi:hypothetical protein
MSLIRDEAQFIRDVWGDRPKPKERRYLSALDLVIAEGRAFTPELSADRGPAKRCYANAGGYALFLDPSRYVYVEGFAVMPKVPLCCSHAWVWDIEEQKALEVTWKTVGLEYIGVAFSTDWFRAWTQAVEVWGVLDNQIMMTTRVDASKYLFPFGAK